MDEDAARLVDEDVARLEEKGGDPLRCSFDEDVSVEFAKAVIRCKPGVKTLYRDGLNEKGERCRWRGVKDTKTGEVEWFNFGQFCPPLPPEFCE